MIYAYRKRHWGTVVDVLEQGRWRLGDGLARVSLWSFCVSICSSLALPEDLFCSRSWEVSDWGVSGWEDSGWGVSDWGVSDWEEVTRESVAGKSVTGKTWPLISRDP